MYIIYVDTYVFFYKWLCRTSRHRDMERCKAMSTEHSIQVEYNKIGCSYTVATQYMCISKVK
jgi:hypothetical protein